MSGSVWVKGDASQSAGRQRPTASTVSGGNAVRDAALDEGIDIVIGGNVGPYERIHGTAGRLVVRGTRARRGRLDLPGPHLRPRCGGIAGRGLYPPRR